MNNGLFFTSLSIGESESAANARKRKRRSRWAPEEADAGPLPITSLPPTNIPPPGYQGTPAAPMPGAGTQLSRVNRTDPGLLRYAIQTFGTTNLSDEDWKKAEDHYKVGSCVYFT